MIEIQILGYFYTLLQHTFASFHNQNQSLLRPPKEEGLGLLINPSKATTCTSAESSTEHYRGGFSFSNSLALGLSSQP
jgi:hypothetical protein